MLNFVFLSHSPESNITWKNSSNHIIAKSDSRFLLDEAYFGRRLIIERVQEGDNGAFTCTANNGHGTEYGSVQVNVTGKYCSKEYFKFSVMGK